MEMKMKSSVERPLTESNIGSNDFKSPISLLYETAAKRNLVVNFITESNGMLFVTKCSVENLQTTGENILMKVSKVNAAMKMLQELEKLPMKKKKKKKRRRRRRKTNTKHLASENISKPTGPYILPTGSMRAADVAHLDKEYNTMLEEVRISSSNSSGYQEMMEEVELPSRNSSGYHEMPYYPLMAGWVAPNTLPRISVPVHTTGCTTHWWFTLHKRELRQLRRLKQLEERVSALERRTAQVTCSTRLSKPSCERVMLMRVQQDLGAKK